MQDSTEMIMNETMANTIDTLNTVGANPEIMKCDNSN
jgi:hypothetical protein